MEIRQLSIFQESEHRCSFLQPNPEGTLQYFPCYLTLSHSQDTKRYLLISDPFSEFIMKPFCLDCKAKLTTPPHPPPHPTLPTPAQGLVQTHWERY